MPPPHDAPGPGELVAAVREFLERDVLGALSGRTRFHALVAINVLGIVERELDLGPGQAERHRARLRDLGFPDDAALAAAIRDGALDDRHAELKDALTAMVRDKLAVADPRHLDD
ncbi:DUF6285 domain-containing protein [Actinomadura harenae]|uniref:DUF6285 domain-containing protein n=1 Tax=Actinomadura harenae TaxID=2483351 RepID=A0A3M2LPB2_9ACTN|nr:DUF6285 domain-containing protein [Actinomadura harenae]RMI39311.1 hypothetical protein EBO15_30140 [Actinomadura harenae]